MIPVSKTVVENAEEKVNVLDRMAAKPQDEVINIKPIICANDFIAILPLRLTSTIAMPGSVYKNEGVVVGVGPGLASDGTRVPSQFSIGDRVYFSDKHVHMSFLEDPEFYDGFYKNKDVFILIERNIICKLPPVPFTIV